MFLGEMIRNYREQNHMTLRDFSARSGISLPYVHQLEQNRNPKTNAEIVPSLATFVKVSNAMGITLDQLLQEVDENQPVGLIPSPRPTGTTVNLAETELLDNFRLLNEEGQEIIMNTLIGLVASGRYIKKSGTDELVEEKA